MTDPSLQKMQTTPPESNMQNLHIPAEWVGVAFAAYDDTAVPDCGTSHHGIKAALTAVIPLVRADAEYPWKLIIAGGEDAPGAANALTLDYAEKRLDNDRREVWQLFNERDRYREALERIACFDDQFGNAGLHVENTYSGFDEPVSAKIARQALKGDAAE